MRQPPPISAWGHTWRVVLVLAISALNWSSVISWQWDHAMWWVALDAGLGIVSFTLMFFRRRHPLLVAVVTNAFGSVSMTSGGPATLTLFSLATRRRWNHIVVASAVAICAGLLFIGNDPSQPDEVLGLALNGALLVSVVGITIGWGMYVGARRELIATLRERAETAEAEQAARVAQARIAERSSIAREMHDVLAHRISNVTLHAGALAFRDDLDPADVKKTAHIIEEGSRRALMELREVLGVLRTGSTNGHVALEPPVPTATSIPDLMSDFQTSGMNIRHDLAVDLAAVPTAAGRTMFRVIQEGLTNVQKHALGALVDVSITGDSDDGLTVRIRNLLPPGLPMRVMPESGLGLVGLSERAELSGGHLTRTVARGRHTLTVWLPWAT